MIKVPYHKLFEKNINLSFAIENAFGNDGLGAILITDIPNFKEKKIKLLKLSKQFGELPEEIQKKYESPETFYAFGWSRGKEKMRNGEPDFAKGSFYANPIYDKPSEDKELIKKYPSNYSENIWPEEIPEYKENFKNLGGMMYKIGLEILLHTDKYLKLLIGKEYPDNNLYNIIKNSKTYKARLLHYYELPDEISKKEDGACGWHLDHGGLTILTKAVYFDADYNEVKEQEDSGLYVKNKDSITHHVNIPENSVLCQIGEMLQVLSGGYLQATPHCVKSSKIKGVTRETFPVFIDCNVEQDISLPKWSRKGAIETKGMKGLVGIPELKQRYEGCKQYHEFVFNTYSKYYN